MDRLENFKVQIIIIVLLQVIALFALYAVGFEGVVMTPMITMLILNVLIIIWIIMRYQNDKTQRDIDISRILGRDAKDALLFGEVGIITYDEQYAATWINDFLEDRDVDIVGKKLTSWIPLMSDLFTGDVDVITASAQGYTYEITRKENSQVLYIRDVTELSALKAQVSNNSIVAGLLQLDNYMEVQQYVDESKMAQINMQLRQPCVEWANKFGMFIRRLRSDRFLVIMNESIFSEVEKDRFSILNTVRKNAEEIDVSITLSMSFARGTEDYQLLDSMVNDLLELAQSRGGDQAAVKKYGENVKYYGGNSEATEKRSKVRVRVIAQAIKEAVIESKRVFIVGHSNMDFDCMGSALCMSRIATGYGKECYVVSGSGGMEPQLTEAFRVLGPELIERHRFIDDNEASDLIGPDDMVIAVDHNNPNQTGAPKTIKSAKRIIVIDHHRRSEDFIQNPLLVYVETSASSVSELAAELLPYQTNKVTLSEVEATMMYDGILVDTNRFRMRTGSRTFEAIAILKKLGADSMLAEDLLREDFQEFEAKTSIMNFSQRYRETMIIAAVDNDGIEDRTLMSQAADSLLNIKGIEASFVIANIKDGKVAISARSKGVINVQLIMEKMHGGGHFGAAALQRDNTNVADVEEELKQMIDEYIEENAEVTTNESNSIR